MKTTIDISDHIMNQSRELARQEHVSLKELVEQGLQLVLQSKAQAATGKVKPVTFKGKGLSPAFRGASWEQIRRAAYEGHGA